MIDVVFQLLIYFLLTAGFMGNERHLRAEMPPEQAEGARSRGLALEAEPLVIRVTRGGGGVRIALDAGLAAPRDARELEQILRDALVAPDRPRGLFTADHPIRIVAAPDLPWQDVVEVFNAVVAAGYRSVAFGGAR
jgi:biopolymer transport protein ExbD